MMAIIPGDPWGPEQAGKASRVELRFLKKKKSHLWGAVACVQGQPSAPPDGPTPDVRTPQSHKPLLCNKYCKILINSWALTDAGGSKADPGAEQALELWKLWQEEPNADTEAVGDGDPGP